MESIRVLIADDEKEISTFFSSLINRTSGMTCVGHAESGRMAVHMAKELHPDIVLMDIQMETGSDGIEAIETLSVERPEIKCIVITIHRGDDYLFRAYAAGAIDFIIKTAANDEIVHSIEEVYHNVCSIRPEVANKLMRECSRTMNDRREINDLMAKIFRLTNSELIVLRMCYYGASYDTIARERFIDPDSVRTAVKRIQKKFDGQNIRKILIQLRTRRIFETFAFLNDI